MLASLNISEERARNHHRLRRSYTAHYAKMLHEEIHRGLVHQKEVALNELRQEIYELCARKISLWQRIVHFVNCTSLTDTILEDCRKYTDSINVEQCLRDRMMKMNMGGADRESAPGA